MKKNDKLSPNLVRRHHMMPHKKTPLIRLTGKHGSVALNKAALDLLLQDEENAVLILKKEDGTILLKPVTCVSCSMLNVPRVKGRDGSPRISSVPLHKLLEVGNYDCVWNGGEEALEIRPTKVETHAAVVEEPPCTVDVQPAPKSTTVFRVMDQAVPPTPSLERPQEETRTASDYLSKVRQAAR